jgi:hypothetical protein
MAGQLLADQARAEGVSLIGRARQPIKARMSRLICKLLLLVAVLFAPGVTGAAMAAASHHGVAVMEAGHCQTPPSTGHHDQTDGKSCCISMCMAVAVAPSAPAEMLLPRQQIAQFAPLKAYHGLPAEIATPPPRRS